MLLRAVLLIAMSLGAPASAQEMRAAGPSAALVWEAPPPLPADYLSLPGLYADLRYHPADEAVALHLAEHAARRLPELAQALGVGAGRTVTITLARDEAAFRSLQPGHPPEWADGTAWPQRGLIFLRSPRARDGTARPLTQVLDHELVHVLLGQAFGPRPVPRWLQEGLAQWMAGEYQPETVHTLNRGQALGALLTLEALSGAFPESPARAQLAYAQSADLIAFVHQEHGEAALRGLVAELSRGAPVNAAFRLATGEAADELDRRWRARLQSTDYGLAGLVADGTWWMVPPSLALVWGAWSARRRNQARLDRWAREEALQDAVERVLREPERPPEHGAA